MKKLVITAVLAASSCIAGQVSTSDAMRAAQAWTSERHSIDTYGGTVTGVVDRTNHYVVLRDSRTALVVSKDDRLPPVLAVVERCDLSVPAAVWDMASNDSSNMMAAVSKPLLASAKSKTRFQRRWDELLGRSLKTLKSGISSPHAKYVVPGFESGGVLTHWDQTHNGVAIYSGNRKPMYNYYMHGPNAGGSSLGLNTRDGIASTEVTNRMSAFIPCGCVATALSAYMQCVGCTGAVDRIDLYNRTSMTYVSTNPTFMVSAPTNMYFQNGTFYNTGTIYYLDSYPVPGVYDWKKLPSNMGGSAPEVLDKSQVSEEARELVGRVAYNCGLEVMMGYEANQSAAITFYAPVAWGAKRVQNSMQCGFFPWCHEKFGEWTTVILGYDPDPVDAVIRAGRPVVFSVQNSSASTGHCILATGRDSETGFTRFFMGWSGQDDGWYAVGDVTSIAGTYDTVNHMVFPSVYGSDTVPVYGRVVNTVGEPVSGMRIDVYVADTSWSHDSTNPSPSSAWVLVKSLRTGQDGFYRGFYTPKTYRSYYNFYLEKVVANGTIVLTADNEPFASGIRPLTLDDGNVKIPVINGTSWVNGRDSALHSSTVSTAYYSYPTNRPFLTGRPLNLVYDDGGTDYRADTSSEFDYAVSDSPGIPLLVIPRGNRNPFPVLKGIDGAKTISVPPSLFSYLSDGEYAVVDSLPFASQSKNTVLAYGVSTNRYDILRYVELAKQKKGN